MGMLLVERVAQVKRTSSNKVVIWEYEDSETSEQLTPELEFIFDSPETAEKIFTSFMALKWPESEYPKLLTTLLTEGVRSRSRTCSLTGPSARGSAAHFETDRGFPAPPPRTTSQWAVVSEVPTSTPPRPRRNSLYAAVDTDLNLS